MTYPQHTGFGWYELSDGRRIKGKFDAEQLQKQLLEVKESERESVYPCPCCNSHAIYRLLPKKAHCRVCGYQFYLA